MRSHARYNRCSADITFADARLYFLPSFRRRRRPRRKGGQQQDLKRSPLLAEARLTP